MGVFPAPPPSPPFPPLSLFSFQRRLSGEETEQNKCLVWTGRRYRRSQKNDLVCWRDFNEELEKESLVDRFYFITKTFTTVLFFLASIAAMFQNKK